MSSTVIMRSSFKDSQLPTLVLMHFYYRQKTCARLLYSEGSKKHHYPGETEEHIRSRLENCFHRVCSGLSSVLESNVKLPKGREADRETSQSPTVSRASETKLRRRGWEAWL